MPQTVEKVFDQPNEVFRHKALVMNQCDTKELFTLNWGAEQIAFKLCDLIALKKKIFSIDLTKLFEVNKIDLEIVYLPHLDRHLLLNLEQILCLRELLDGTFAVLHINSQVHRTLYNPFTGSLQA